MTVLITNINKEYFLSLNPKLKFKDSTKNTSTFDCTTKEFTAIREKVREAGHNPYAVMSW